MIKNRRNQRKGMLTARQKLRYEVVSQDGTCPSFSEAQEKKARLEDRRWEEKHVSTRLGNTHQARHHLWLPYLLRWGSCPHSGHQSRGAALWSVQAHAVSQGTKLWPCAPYCLDELRGVNWTLPTFLESAGADMKYSCST